MKKLSLSTVTAFLGLVSLSEAADIVVELPAKHFDLIESYWIVTMEKRKKGRSTSRRYRSKWTLLSRQDYGRKC